MRNEEAPSLRAASYISTGMLAMNCRIKKM
jgi:hypothetical protein